MRGPGGSVEGKREGNGGVERAGATAQQKEGGDTRRVGKEETAAAVKQAAGSNNNTTQAAIIEASQATRLSEQNSRPDKKEEPSTHETSKWRRGSCTIQ